MDYKPICNVVGALMINLTLGTFYSIGNVIPYLASYMRLHNNPDVTSEHGTWITATFLLGQGLFIIVGSYIERQFSSRVACIVGCILHCTSTYLTIWAINVSMSTVILVYGFGSGIGCGSAYMASIIAAQKWFPARKGLFTGIIVSGFGCGGLIFTNLQTLYLNPSNISPDPNTGYFDKDVADRVPNLFLYSAIIFTVVQIIGCSLAFPPPSNQPPSTTGEDSGGQRGPTQIHSDDVVPRMIGLTSAFEYKIFYVIGALMMLVAPGVTFVNSLGKRFGQTFIHNDRFLSTVVAIAAVANAGGRLTWGYLADRFSFATCFLIKVALFAFLIATFPFDFVLTSQTNYMIWMLGLFFGFSGTFVLFPVYIRLVFGSQYSGVIYGVLYMLLATSSIMTSFVIQSVIGPALANKDTSPLQKSMTRKIPCWGIAGAYLLSYAIFYLALPVRRVEKALRNKYDVEASKARTSNLAQRPDLLANVGGTSPTGKNDSRENSGGKIKSLGSIVRFSETPIEIDKTRIKMPSKSLRVR